MANNSLVKTVLEEAASILLPIRRLQSSQNVTALIRNLGWELPDASLFPNSFPVFVGEIEAVFEKLCALEKSTDPNVIASHVTSLYDEIKSLFSSISNCESQIRQALNSYSNFLEKSGILEEFPVRLIDYLVIQYLQADRPAIYTTLVFLGLIENIAMPTNKNIYQPQFTLRKMNWERLPVLFDNPLVVAEEVYKWESSFNSDLFSSLVGLLIRTYAIPGGIYNQDPCVCSALGRSPENSKELRIPFFQEGEWPETYAEAGVSISPVPATQTQKIGIATILYLIGKVGVKELTYDLNKEWQLLLVGSGDLNTGIGVVIRPPKRLEILTALYNSKPTQVGAKLEVKLARKTSENEEFFLFGSENSSHLSIKDFALSFSAQKSEKLEELLLKIAITGIQLAITSDKGDGFIKKLFPKNGVRTGFDLVIGWSSIDGVFFGGSAALEATIPVHISLGPLTIDSVYLSMQVGKETPINTAISAAIRLGPLLATTEKIGLTTKLLIGYDKDKEKNYTGKLGPLAFAQDFKPPSGIGLLVGSSTVKGGGYLFSDNDQYIGVLQLEFNNIALKAIGIITTRMPDGSSGYSLLICISAEFPGIQLGFGFTLNGVGGLLGVNRTMVTKALQEGIRKRTLDSILFPQDPVANIQKIISDMRTVFPPADKRYVIGPMAIIGWGTPTIVRAEIGLILELPAPIRLALLGQIRLTLPKEEKALVLIKMDILGILDFERKLFAIDATIYDSKILEFALSGDMAMRLNWGERPNFALSIGGLHPRFQPPPEFPTLRRLQLSLGEGDNPRLLMQTYLAVTSNSVQFGSRLELYAEAEGFTVNGFLGYDALFILAPFSFIVEIGGGVAIEGHGVSIGVGLDLLLSGPTPWHVSGKAKFKICFIKFTVHFSATFGRKEGEPLPSINPWDFLKPALQDKGNWSGALPTGMEMLTSLRAPMKAEKNALILPMCPLEIHQKVLPLNVKLTRFGEHVPESYDEFGIDNVQFDGQPVGNTEIQDSFDDFAPAQFTVLSDADKITSPSFEKMKSGVKLFAEAIEFSGSIPLEITYETILIKDKTTGERQKGNDYKPVPKDGSAMFAFSAARTSRFHNNGARKFQSASATPKVVKDVAFTLASTDKLLAMGKAGTFLQARRMLENMPLHEKKKWQIVPLEEAKQS